MIHSDIFPAPEKWLSDVGAMLVDSVNKWAASEIMARRHEMKEGVRDFLIPAMDRLYNDIGLGGLMLPEKAGGAGLDSAKSAVTAAAVCEAVGRADVGISFALANTLALQASAMFAGKRSKAAKEKAATLFFNDGKTSPASLILPGLGGKGDLKGLGYPAVFGVKKKSTVIKGKKARPQCCGLNAELFGVVCDAGDGLPALALVLADQKGVKKGDGIKKTGLAASDNCDVSFKDVTLTKDRIVFQGEEDYRRLLTWYYLGCAATCSGAMLAGWEILKEWGDTRVIKGKGQVFKENPLVANLMGDVGAEIGTGRLLVYTLAKMLAEPKSFGNSGGAFATATAVISQVVSGAMDFLDGAMELMASAGYATEWNLERYWRDVKTLQNHLGPQAAINADMARYYFYCEKI